MSNNPISFLQSGLREAAAKAVIDEFGDLIFKMDTKDSGRLLESCLQVMADDAFKTLAYLVIGNEADELARALIYELAFRVAQKLAIEITSPEQIVDAVSNIWILVNAENLRRKGQMEYLAPDNLYTSEPKYPGWNRLTDAGKEITYKAILENKKTDSKYVM